MEVILTQVVPKLGKKDQVVKVARGYARNYLFPRGLAVVASKGQKEALQKRKARTQAKVIEEKEKAETLKEKLDEQTLRIAGNVAKGSTKLFGAVTSQDVVEAIQKEFGVSLDKKQVGLLNPIKRTGIYRIQIDLHQEVDAFINLDVYNPHEPTTEAQEPVATPASE
jgi:large subunit ribosomal protein L9